MPEQVSFIGREKEVALIDTLIDKLIKSLGSQYVIILYGEGGIGKSRLLREVYERYSQKKIKNLTVGEIIYFDDLTFHIPENVTRKISQMLDSKSFKSYLQAEIDHRKIQSIGVSAERLEEEKNRVHQEFLKCFNDSVTSHNQRLVLFFDTTDKLEKGGEVWKDLEKKLPSLKNTVVIIAGRNANKLGKSLKTVMEKGSVIVKHLKSLSMMASMEYLKEKQKQKHITVESELADKLIHLAAGRPILLDLAVEWRARGISMNWLANNQLEELQKLDQAKLKDIRRDFEKQLVYHIKDIRSPMDQLVLLMGHVYPLNIEMISSLLNGGNSQDLFEDAKTYVFIKELPNNYITLHDIMRDMVNEYVWPEADPENERRRWHSNKVLIYYKNEIENLVNEIHKISLKLTHKLGEEAFKLSLQRDELVQRTWVLREQLLHHTLFIDIHKGLTTFVELFNDATKESRFLRRQRFISMVDYYQKKLSPKQLCILDFHKAQQLFIDGKYEGTKSFCIKLLKYKETTINQKVETLILKGNAEIRLGEVGASIPDFEEAVKISEKNNLKLQDIRAKNALGWAHRLTGDLDVAKRYYAQARVLCLQVSDPEGPEKPEIANDYGLIINNYAYALSSDNKTRKAAMDLALTAIEHWKKTGNEVGLGAGYLVLGIAYYQSDLGELALEAFQKSLSIFESLKLNDWLGQIYSWRGAQYHDQGRYKEAEEDFKRSLQIGTPNIKAMTLNRLGRIYMYYHRWDLAEERMLKSLDLSKKIPDYVYWLGSIARLISISAKKYITDKDKLAQEYDKYREEVEIFEKSFKNPDKNSQGMAYLGLAKLAFLLNDMNMKKPIVKYLQEGIPLVVEYGSYARSDILTRLNIVEEDFDKTGAGIIRAVGKEMQNFVIQKEVENINYSAVLDRMFRWANWKKVE